MITIPDSFAISDQRVRLSAVQLREEVHSVTSAILQHGLQPGERVIVLGRKSVELAAAMLAVPRTGGVVVAPYAGLTEEQLRYIVQDASPSLAILLDSAPREMHAAVTDVPTVVQYASLRDSAHPTREPAEAHPDAAALIIYTSGSTDKPKGVVFSHQNIRLGAESVAQYYGLTPEDRVLCLLPFSFDAGFNQLTSALVAGCETYLRDFALAQHTTALCGEQRITTLTGVPALWRKLTAVQWPGPARDAMRRWCNTGGHMPVDLSRRLCALFPNADPILMYGFTEAFRATYLPPARYRARPTSVGVAIPHAAVAIVHDDGTLCAPGEVGELVQFGPLVTLGYWNRQDETDTKFAAITSVTRRELTAPATALYCVPVELLDRPAWSGDNVSIDSDGFIYFHSRRTELIKSQGFRVSPTEVEEACIASGLVHDAVVLGVEHDGEEAVAVVATPVSPDVSSEDLRAKLKRALPSYQVPQVIVLTEELPATANGKYDIPAIRLQLVSAAQALT
jgi:acyl-CoA synthetase (AMP-forming)/AMP-acid ligase II